MKRTRILHIAICICVAGLAAVAAARAEVVTYVLHNVWLLPNMTHPRAPAQQMTGSLRWTYEVGDFENGSGEFIDLSTPWYDPGIEELNITIESTSIEFSLVGNYHDLGLDLTLRLLEPLSLDQPATIDRVNSLFEIQQGISHMGHVVSGSVVPVLGDCPADITGDGLNNLADLANFAGCMSGPDLQVELDCLPADLNGDGQADLADFAELQITLGCP